MVDYSLAAFAAAEAVTSIVVAVPAGLSEELRAEIAAQPKVSSVVDGGEARQDSLARALRAVPVEVEVVAVHDAARPLVTSTVIGAVLAALAGADGAIAAIPLDDAVKDVAEGGLIRGPRSRAGLWRAQTPQAFRRASLETALERAIADGVVCDDCSEMATRIGYRVVVVPGSPRNLKVTRGADLELCEALLAGGGES
jgi:2-C-methyl-D-erythritol 4-phosphate cytidylyltransferase